MHALEEMTSWQGADAARSAENMLAAIQTFDFIIVIQCNGVIENVASLLLLVSRRLQAADIELSATRSDVSELLVALDDFHSEEKYNYLLEYLRNTTCT